MMSASAPQAARTAASAAVRRPAPAPPARPSSGVSTRIHCAPTVCIQVPSMLPSWANHSARKARIRSGDHSDGGDDDTGPAAPDRPAPVTGDRPDAGSTPDVTDRQPTLAPTARRSAYRQVTRACAVRRPRRALSHVRQEAARGQRGDRHRGARARPSHGQVDGRRRSHAGPLVGSDALVCLSARKYCLRMVSVDPDVTAVAADGAGADRPKRGRLLVFGVVAIALLMVSIDQTSVATALPSIQHDLRTSLAWSGWTITVYSLGQIIGMPVAGKLTDQFGRKAVFMVVVGVFTLASLCAGLVARHRPPDRPARGAGAGRGRASCPRPPASSPTSSDTTATARSACSPASSRSARSSARSSAACW